MKKAILFLSACALLAACDSGYKPDGSDTARANDKTGTGKLNADSASETNLAAVAHQPQVDTSVSKLVMSTRAA